MLLLALTLAAGACGQAEVSSERWKAMSPDEKELVVRAQLGGEAASGAKGGEPRKYGRPARAYVEAIDALYAAGESRSVGEIWPELADGGNPGG